MDVNLSIVIGSAVVGLLVGLTGAGGGALMTPMLILLFRVAPAAAISSDLVAAMIMRPAGAAVHWHKGTVNARLVGWMTLGSAPMAFLGAYLLSLLGNGPGTQRDIEYILGAALLAGAGAMVFRDLQSRRSAAQRSGTVRDLVLRPIPTVLISMVGGLMVGMTSVGSGSLMIVLLLFVYPRLAGSQLVGTFLVQAVPLTMAAAFGALLFGHVKFGVTTSLVIGGVPAVIIGSFLSSRAPDHVLQPLITFVIFASGLKYVGLGTPALVWVLAAVLLVAGGYWLIWVRPVPRRAAAAAEPALAAEAGPPVITVNGAQPAYMADES
jgi:uncharacterized protein